MVQENYSKKPVKLPVLHRFIMIFPQKNQPIGIHMKRSKLGKLHSWVYAIYLVVNIQNASENSRRNSCFSHKNGDVP